MFLKEQNGTLQLYKNMLYLQRFGEKLLKEEIDISKLNQNLKMVKLILLMILLLITLI